MREKKMAPHVAGPNNNAIGTDKDNDGEKKWRRILRVLAGGARLTRFDAERHGDHAFNSTVADLGRLGIVVSREPITLEGRFGPIHCKKYWLEADAQARARALLGEVP